MEAIPYLALSSALLALLLAGYFYTNVKAASPGNERMIFLMNEIEKGARAFLRQEYSWVSIFVAVMAILIGVLIAPVASLTYIIGAVLSATAGYAGMTVATMANARTANAAQDGPGKALPIAFRGGAVMGFSVAGLALGGLALVYILFVLVAEVDDAFEVVTAYGLGASSIALFSRVGGGIYTKAADVGADLVGKVEAGIPEDDPRNPATIADNVGDNVGDVAGMGADLFESYVGSIISAIALAAGSMALISSKEALLPLMIAGAGIIASILGTFLVRSSENANFGQLLWALRKGIFSSAILVAIFSGGIIYFLEMSDGISLFICIITGLIAGTIIGTATEYYTSYEYKPTKNVAENAQTGAATVIISGFATGMMSTLIPVIAIGATILIAYELQEFYGIALAGVGLLSTLGITLATDAYGPVADNAGGIAEQAQLAPEVRQRTDALDALGNTTAATGKGFAIGSAALTSLALLAAFAQAAGLFDGDGINILKHTTLAGMLIGAMLPFIFSALTMNAVGRAAFSVVNEVRRQFREIEGLLDGKATPDYERCVDISTRGALREMISLVCSL